MDNLDGTFSFPESVGNTTGLNSELTFGVLVRDIKDVRVDGVSVVGEDKVANILLADLIEDVTYDADNGTFRFIKKDGSHIEVDLPIENFIKGGYYNSETKSIVLILQNDDEVSIQIENLLDGYVAQSDIVDNLLSTDTDKPLSANQGKILRETIQGKELGRVFNNIQSMINSVNSQPRDKFRLAFMLYILDTQVPDFWVAGIEETSIPYTYTTDEAFLSAIRIAPVQVGYFKVSISETAKVDLENYVQKDGDKVLSDNNYTDADKAKVDIIETDGDGTKYLSDDGTYKEAGKVDKVNNILPDLNKNVTLTSSDIKHNEEYTIAQLLERLRYKEYGPSLIPALFSDATPAQIKLAIETDIPESWNIGDTHTITIDGLGTFTLEIYDMQDGRYSIVGGGSTKMVLGFKEIIEETAWNSTQNNVYETALIRTNLNGTLFNMMPSDWKNLIKEVLVPTATAGSQAGGNVIKYLPEKLFLMSGIELFGNSTDSHPGEGTVFQYYDGSTSSKRVKYLNASPTAWWLRSPAKIYTIHAVAVGSTSGNPLRNTVNIPRGISPVFAI